MSITKRLFQLAWKNWTWRFDPVKKPFTHQTEFICKQLIPLGALRYCHSLWWFPAFPDTTPCTSCDELSRKGKNKFNMESQACLIHVLRLSKTSKLAKPNIPRESYNRTSTLFSFSRKIFKWHTCCFFKIFHHFSFTIFKYAGFRREVFQLWKES